MKTACSFLVLVPLAFIGGCVPNATIYFRPTVEIASTHEKSHCVPTEKFVHFTVEAGGSTLKVKGQADSYSRSYAEGTEGQYVIVGNWKEIRLKSNDFVLRTPGSTESIKPNKTYGDASSYDGYSMFNLGAVFPKQTSDSFHVRFPTLIVDGDEVELPVLHAKKTVWAGISPFNC
jgi:hypothetical protein